MKKNVRVSLLVMIVTLLVSFAAYAALQNGAMQLAPGDEVYACGCGEACPCKTLSRSPGKCACGVDLVKAKVVKVEEGKAVLDINGKEETFPTVGKYACACGPGCGCDTISQKPGNCACGNPMKAVE